MVNGPEGDVLDWDAVDWRQAEDDVRRLRQRIFTASKAGDLKKVRSLQKLMLRSRASARGGGGDQCSQKDGRLTTDVSLGVERSETITEADAAVEVVRAWLREM